MCSKRLAAPQARITAVHYKHTECCCSVYCKQLQLMREKKQAPPPGCKGPHTVASRVHSILYIPAGWCRGRSASTTLYITYAINRKQSMLSEPHTCLSVTHKDRMAERGALSTLRPRPERRFLTLCPSERNHGTAASLHSCSHGCCGLSAFPSAKTKPWSGIAHNTAVATAMRRDKKQGMHIRTFCAKGVVGKNTSSRMGRR